VSSPVSAVPNPGDAIAPVSYAIPVTPVSTHIRGCCSITISRGVAVPVSRGIFIILAVSGCIAVFNRVTVTIPISGVAVAIAIAIGRGDCGTD